MEAVAAMRKLEIQGNYVIGEAVLLDNPKANQLKTLIDNGIKISVSSRGSGTVRDGVVNSFNLITYDLVDAPSDHNASMYGECIFESEKEFVMIDGKLVESKSSQNPEDNTKGTEKDPEEKNELKESFLEFINILKNKK